MNTWKLADKEPPDTSRDVFVLLLGKYPAIGQYCPSSVMWVAQAKGSAKMNHFDGAHVTHWMDVPKLLENAIYYDLRT